jgi:hypothetical protein
VCEDKGEIYTFDNDILLYFMELNDNELIFDFEKTFLNDFQLTPTIRTQDSATKDAVTISPELQADGEICKHWLRGLCKKGDNCEFLHEYDLSKMPECYFYSKFGNKTLFYLN